MKIEKSLLLILSASLSAPLAEAKVFLTVKEAIQVNFPASEQWITTTETKYLTAEQMKKASELSGHSTPSALVVRHRASKDQGKQVEYAYTDTHKVRTHTETLFVIVDSTGKIKHFEVLAFEEPLEYMPKDLWYGKFKNTQLNPELEVKRQIPFVTGASLTAHASTQGARRILAIHEVLQQKVEKK